MKEPIIFFAKKSMYYTELLDKTRTEKMEKKKYLRAWNILLVLIESEIPYWNLK